MFFNRLKLGFILCSGLVLSACSSDARYYEIQSARLGECNYMADKEYHECIKRQEGRYGEFKKQQTEQQVSKND
ncbi:MAG: hypothetical protein ACTH7Q_08120 [Pseudoalteromonas sp.]